MVVKRSVSLASLFPLIRKKLAQESLKAAPFAANYRSIQNDYGRHVRGHAKGSAETGFPDLF